MDFLLTYQWDIFIAIEILSLVMLLLFGVVRYALDRKKQSSLFIVVFLALIAAEALLAFLLYQETGEISTFQVVITVFVLYVCTFGIIDFKNLDRWMRKKVGNWRGKDLLTANDYRIIERNNNPKFLARKYRWTSCIHLIVFVIVQSVFWMYGTQDLDEMMRYLRDLSWIEAGSYEKSPYPNEGLYSIGMLWGIVFAVDFIWSWSYTFFPSK